MTQFGWGFVTGAVRPPVTWNPFEHGPEPPPDVVKSNWYYTFHTYLGNRYLTHAPTRLVWDAYRGKKHFTSRGVGGPSGTPPSSTIPSKRRQGRASAEHGKHGGPRRESRRGGRARRKECPKGHYWSYKHKKCLKSKF